MPAVWKEVRVSSKDCPIVSGLYRLTRGMQSNNPPTTHRESHSFHPGLYFTRLWPHCTVRMHVCLCRDCLQTRLNVYRSIFVSSLNKHRLSTLCDSFVFCWHINHLWCSFLSSRSYVHTVQLYACFITSQTFRENARGALLLLFLCGVF